MAQEILNVNSSSDNDGLGDTPPVFADKCNSNFTELYDALESGNNTVYLYSESDLPNQTATTWSMNSDVPYKLAASFTTSKQCIPAAGASLRGDNLGSYVLSYSGSGSMFKGTDVNFFINNITVDPGITNTGFEFSDSVGGTKRFIAENVQVLNCAIWGKFTDMSLTQITNCSGENTSKGVQFFGTQNNIWSVSKFALSSTSATFIGVDMGSATANVPEFDDMFMSAPAGAFGVSGLSNSGNVPIGSLGRIYGSEFNGGMTDLQNLSVQDDIRWVFRDNTPTMDTYPDALIYFKGNATETVISASSSDGSNSVLVAGTWIESQASLFSTTSGGRITYLPARSIKAPITVSLGVRSSGGGTISVTVYISRNGVVDLSSGSAIEISGSVPRTITIPWQLQFNENDYIETKVENNTNTTNVIVQNATIRVL
jgi:hypothetical protein